MRIYRVTVSAEGWGDKTPLNEAAAAAFAAANGLPGAKPGQLGPYHRAEFTERPTLPRPPRGVKVEGWTFTGIQGSGESFDPCQN